MVERLEQLGCSAEYHDLENGLGQRRLENFANSEVNGYPFRIRDEKGNERKRDFWRSYSPLLRFFSMDRIGSGAM